MRPTCTTLLSLLALLAFLFDSLRVNTVEQQAIRDECTLSQVTWETNSTVCAPTAHLCIVEGQTYANAEHECHVSQKMSHVSTASIGRRLQSANNLGGSYAPSPPTIKNIVKTLCGDSAHPGTRGKCSFPSKVG